MAVVNFKWIFCCCLLHLDDISEKVIHATYDNLIYILKLVMPDFARAPLLRRFEGA